MKNELIKLFVKKTIVKTAVFAFIMVVIAALVQSASPLVSNELALTQMQNSNEMYVLMNTYNKIRPIVNVVYAGIVALFVYTLGRDTSKFVKTINTVSTENEKEN